MKAAITASDRGHKVTIIEKQKELGGMLRFISKEAHKEEVQRLRLLSDTDFQKRNRSPSEYGSRSGTGKRIAAGFTSYCIWGSGENSSNPSVEGEKVQLATKAIAHPEQLGQNIVILGGGSIGCEIGLELAENGKNVTILELTDTLAANANSLYREALRQKFLLHENLHSLLKCGCSRIEEDVVIYKNESDRDSL